MARFLRLERLMMPSSLKRPALVGIAAMAIFAAPLVAQMNFEKPGARQVSRVTSGTYMVDHHHTMVGWRLDHMGMTPYFGTFGDVTGTLVLDKDYPANSTLDITIPVAKVTTPSAGLNEHLLRAPRESGGKADFFGPDPVDARFVMTSLVPDLGTETASMTGDLTLNGITKPVTLDVSFYGAGKFPVTMGGAEGIGFTSTGAIKRSDFGVSFGIPMISDEVQLDIVAGFVKKPD
jgi:polyisoprenoid-binding protein YceI